MLSGLTGRRPQFKAVTRGGLLSIGLILGLGLSACTTVEGTNALTDVGTFEREVMSETLRGVGMIDKEVKPEDVNRRGPLVLPKDDKNLPAPQEGDDKVADLLPEDSAKVRVDATGLSAADIQRIKDARVIDVNSSSGRPLTQAEIQKLTAKMKQPQLNTGPRPLYFPPEEYFTTVKGQDVVCLAPNGELVPLNDKACPPAVRKALEAQAN